MIKELREIDKRILSTLRDNGKMLSIDLAAAIGMTQKDLLQQLISLNKRGYLGVEFFDEKHKTRLWFALAKRKIDPHEQKKACKPKPALDEHDEWLDGLKAKKVKFNPWGKSDD